MVTKNGLGQVTAHEYDGLAKFLHWSIALLVLANFLLAEFWDDFARPAKHLMITAHMTLGVLLTLALAAALIWRFKRRRLYEAPLGLQDLAARVMQDLLYLLLCVQILLGFGTRWTQNHALQFFSLGIPSPFGKFSRHTAHVVDHVHDYLAWVIIVLAALHMLAALAHHFIWRDRVLRNMLP